MLLLAAAGGAAASPQPPAEGGERDAGDFIVDLFNNLPKFIEHGVLFLVSVLLVIAIALLGYAVWRRMMSASLVVRPFLDGAVDVKVGAGMASLVEERLVGALRRKGRGDAGYDLDRVDIDIELLAEDDDLAKAMERLADVPQLRLVGALIALIERMLPSRGLSAAGELLPAGGKGVGVALALYKGSRLNSRSSLWEHEVSLWFPGEGRGGPRSERSASSAPDHAAHYGLAAPAAWWVQYEAARIFDRHVSLVTNSAPSFSLVGVALAHERQGNVEDAEDAYASALTLDPGNVAALFNLGQSLARKHRSHAPAALLLFRAQESLEYRHRLPRPATHRGLERQLRDPTWYRIQYALALQCLEISVKGGDWKSAEGWPKGMSLSQPDLDAAWKESFGADAQDLLMRLADDQRSVQWPSEEPATEATRRAEDLFATAAWVLNEAGWHWVGRRPPRFVKWWRGIASWPGRAYWKARRRGREAPVAYDRQLLRFLSKVAEPTAVILYCSTIVDEYKRFRDLVLERADPVPLDRRKLASVDPDEWAVQYLSVLLADERIDERWLARLIGRLGRTQLRAPAVPDPRARYGLACMFSRLAAQAEARGDAEALPAFLWSSAAQLDGALSASPDDRREALAAWARVDPDLDGLRDHARSTFDTIVARWGPAERRVERTKLESSVLSSAAYSEDSRILELQFEDGSRYQYFGVPGDVHEELMSAESAGEFFNQKIKRKFAFVRI